MIILLCLLKISTSQEHKDNKANYIHNKTVSNGELCTRNSDSYILDTNNGFKKRFKPLDSVLDPYEDFGLLFYDLNNYKSSKTSSEWDLDKELFGHDTFSEFEANDMINKGCIEISRELDSLTDSSINNKNDLGNIPHINVPDVPKENNLSYQQHSRMFITELKKNLEIRQTQSFKDQLEIINLNKDIMIDFVSNIEQLKNKKIRSISSVGSYPHNKENVSCLYPYLLKAKVASMGNLNLLNILISEIEYNNEVMIYCFLASNTYKILCFIVENFDKLDINPTFFYNVGLFMEKYWSRDFSGGCFQIPWKTGNGDWKSNALSVFIKVYRSLEVHNEMNLPEIFNQNFINMCEKTQLETITLYNLVKEKYSQNLTQIDQT